MGVLYGGVAIRDASKNDAWQSSEAVEMAAPMRVSRWGSLQPRASSKITGDPPTLQRGRTTRMVQG